MKVNMFLKFWLVAIFISGLLSCDILGIGDDSTSNTKTKELEQRALALALTNFANTTVVPGSQEGDFSVFNEEIVVLASNQIKTFPVKQIRSATIDNSEIEISIDSLSIDPSKLSAGAHSLEVTTDFGSKIVPLFILKREMRWSTFTKQAPVPSDKNCFYITGISWNFSAAELAPAKQGLINKLDSINALSQCKFLHILQYSLGLSVSEKRDVVINYVINQNPGNDKIMLIGISQGGIVAIQAANFLKDVQELDIVLGINSPLSGLPLENFKKLLPDEFKILFDYLPELKDMSEGSESTKESLSFLESDFSSQKINLIGSNLGCLLNTDLVIPTNKQLPEEFSGSKTTLSTVSHFTMGTSPELAATVSKILNGTKPSIPVVSCDEEKGVVDSFQISDLEIGKTDSSISLVGQTINMKFDADGKFRGSPIKSTIELEYNIETGKSKSEIYFATDFFGIPGSNPPIRNVHFKINSITLLIEDTTVELSYSSTLQFSIYKPDSGDACGSGLRIQSTNPSSVKIDGMIQGTIDKNQFLWDSKSEPLKFTYDGTQLSLRHGYYTYNFGWLGYGCGNISGIFQIAGVTGVVVQENNGNFVLNASTTVGFFGSNIRIPLKFDLGNLL